MFSMKVGSEPRNMSVLSSLVGIQEVNQQTTIWKPPLNLFDSSLKTTDSVNTFFIANSLKRFKV